MKISTVIITLNEEELISKCIDRALKISDDIVIIDANSQDKTVEIAKGKGARVYVRDWKGYGPTKNFGIEMARYDWILSIDADEILSTKLIANLNALNLKEDEVYQLDLQTIIEGKKIKFSGFYPAWKKRLFNRKFVKWNSDEVHEALSFSKETRIKKIKGKVWHYSVKTWEQFEDKQDQYAKLSAKRWIAQGKQPNIIKRTFGPSFKFFRMYFLDLGILDGARGFQLARIMMKANRKKYNFLISLKKESHSE